MADFEVADDDRDLAYQHAQQVEQIQDWAAFMEALEPTAEPPQLDETRA